MLKRFLSLALVALIFIGAAAQESKPKILVKSFKSSVGKTDCQRIRKNVLGALDNTLRFVITDSDLLRETSDETAELSNLVEGNYNYVVEGNVLALKTKSEVDKDGKRQYNYNYTFSLTFTDPKSTRTIFTENYDYSSSFIYDSEEEALNRMSGSINDAIAHTVNINLPITGNLITIDYTGKKGKIETCYIALGSDLGVHKGMYFQVSKASFRAGRTIYTKVARLKVIEVLDGTLSNCKVTSGGKDLFKAIKDHMELDEATRESRPFKVTSVESNNLIKEVDSLINLL